MVIKMLVLPEESKEIQKGIRSFYPTPVDSIFYALLTGYFQKLVDSVAPSPFNLRQLEKFPFVKWSSMREFYRPLVEWFECTQLNEQIVDKATGDAVDKFPFNPNPIPSIVKSKQLMKITLCRSNRREEPIEHCSDPCVDLGSDHPYVAYIWWIETYTRISDMYPAGQIRLRL